MRAGLQALVQFLPEPITRRLVPTSLRKKLHLLSRTESEVDFWRAWFETGGGRFHDQFAARTQKARWREVWPSYLEPLVDELTNRFPGERLEVLDLGSGPISLLAWGHESGLYRLTCIDPLGQDYQHLLADHRIDSHIPIHTGRGEDLDQDQYFHLAFVCNALDHCADPALVLANLVRAVKRGGYVVISSAVDEGSNMNWTAGHDHNLNLEGRHLSLTGRDGVRKLLTDDTRLKPVWSQRAQPAGVHRGYFEVAYERR